MIRKEVTSRDAKVEILLTAIWLAALFFLCDGWAAVVCLAGVAVIGFRWMRYRGVLVRELLLGIVLMVTAVLLLVNGIRQMAPTRYFGEMCDNLFANPQLYRALDQQQNDVTDVFVEKYRSTYEQGDEDALREAFLQELSAISWVEENKQEEQETIRTDYQIHVYLFDRIEEIDKCFEQFYVMEGSMVQDVKTREVLEYENPRFHPTEFYGQNGLEGMPYGISLGAEPSEDGKELEIRSSISMLLSRSKLPQLMQMTEEYKAVTKIQMETEKPEFQASLFCC